MVEGLDERGQASDMERHVAGPSTRRFSPRAADAASTSRNLRLRSISARNSGSGGSGVPPDSSPPGEPSFRPVWEPLGLRLRRRDRQGHYHRDRKTAPGALAVRLWAERALLGQGESARLKQFGNSVARWRRAVDPEAERFARGSGRGPAKTPIQPR